MSLFFELLQLSLGTRDKFSRVPSLPEWEAIYDEAERQAIASLLFSGIESLPAEQMPPLELKLQWIGETQIDEATYKLHVQRAAELTRRFLSVGFKSCVLKGVGMAQYYPEPERRLCGDIDLLVDGRRKDVMARQRTQCKIGYMTWHHVEAKFFEDVDVEVHFFPIWLYNPIRNWRLQRYFKKQMVGQMVEREMGFGYPSVEFNAIYSLVHTFHHLMDEGVGLRHVVDYFYILKSIHTENKSTEVVAALQRFGLMKFLRAMMYVLKVACGMAPEYLLCKPDEKAGKFLLDEIMLAGNFGHFDARVVIPKDESFLHRNIRKFRRQLRFLKYYPGEVLCAPIWKTWHWCWRFMHRDI